MTDWFDKSAIIIAVAAVMIFLTVVI